MRIVLLALLLCPAAAHAGAWARDLGGVYLRLGGSIFVGDSGALLPDVAGAPAGRFEGRAVDLYAEVGLGVNLELDLSARWVDHRHALDDGTVERASGPGDLEVLLKWAPLNAASAFALTAGARVAPYGMPSLAERAEGRPPLGPGGTDVLTGFAFGRSFWPAPGWLTGELLHRLRLGAASTGLQVRVEGGWRLLAPLALAGELAWQPAFGRDLDQPEDAPAPVPDELKLGAKLLAGPWWGFGATADATWLPDLGNDGPGWRVSAGVTWER